MSLQTELDNAVRRNWVGINDEILDRSYSFWKMLLRNPRKDAPLSNYIEFDVWDKRLQGAAYRPYDTLNVVRREMTKKGSLQYSNYAMALSIDGPSLRANNGVSVGQLMSLDSLRELPNRDTALQLFSLINKQMDRVLSDFAYMLGEHSYLDGSANGGAALVGKQAIINNSTSVYANLNPTNFDTDGVTGSSWWTPIVLNNSGTNRNMTLELIGQMIDYVQRGNETDEEILCVVNGNLWQELQLLLEAQKVYQSDELHSIGVKNIQWQFCTFIRDELAPDNEMNFFNLKHLWVQVRPSGDFRFDGFVRAIDQDAVAGHVIADLQIVCDDRHRQGLLDDISGIHN